VLLLYLNAIFKIWMLVDAGRRGIDKYWYFIILLPFGDLFYFFTVKIHDYDLKEVKRAFLLERAPPVDQLRRLAEETPSLVNKIALAQGLQRAKNYEEAKAVFAEILKQDDTDKDALYGEGLCLVQLEELDAATKRLKELIELDPAFMDYEPWFDCAFAYWQAGDKEKAVEILKQLVDTSPRLKHKAILGKYLVRAGDKDAARTMLEGAVDDYEHSTGYVKRTSGKWLLEVRTTLREL